MPHWLLVAALTLPPSVSVGPAIALGIAPDASPPCRTGQATMSRTAFHPTARDGCCSAGMRCAEYLSTIVVPRPRTPLRT